MPRSMAVANVNVQMEVRWGGGLGVGETETACIIFNFHDHFHFFDTLSHYALSFGVVCVWGCARWSSALVFPLLFSVPLPWGHL